LVASHIPLHVYGFCEVVNLIGSSTWYNIALVMWRTLIWVPL